MKFPFDFNITLIFRLVFPGIVLAVTTLPVLMAVLGWMGLDKLASDALVLPVAAVFFGWLIVLGDTPIYMMLEGRGFAPGWLLEWMRARQATRLERLKTRYAKLKVAGKTEQAREADIMKLDYPIGAGGEFYAQMPTQLGNLMYAYETYSNTAYKIDAVFYWYRLWLVLDQDLRTELSETQAVADSAVYVCFATMLSAVIVILYAIGGYVALYAHIRWFDLPLLPSPTRTLVIAAAMLVFARFLYGLAMYQQRVYGELFKSLFDQFRDKLTFVTDVTALAVAKGAAQTEDKFKVTSRYLRWHRIRPAGQANNISPEAWAAVHPAPARPPPAPAARLSWRRRLTRCLQRL